MKQLRIASALVVFIAATSFAQEGTPPAHAADPAQPAAKAEKKAAKAEKKDAKADAKAEKKDAAKAPEKGGGNWMAKAAEGKELYATFKTSEGDVVVKLFKDAPKTVANFVGLATGEKEWTHPGTQKKSKDPLYSGTIFHRVIPNFMIQGGDPLGSGMGDPGYRFEDELQNGRKFDKPGILAMANSGPNTNGSQFFITVAATPWLSGKHTIFGEVISGYPNVVKISQVARNPMDRPNKDVVLQKIEISDKAPKTADVAKN